MVWIAEIITAEQKFDKPLFMTIFLSFIDIIRADSARIIFVITILFAHEAWN